MTTLEEKIAVMQAAQRGEKIEWRWHNSGPDAWLPAPGRDGLSWDWLDVDYRVAPKEMTIWVCSWCDTPGTTFATSSDPSTRNDASRLIIHSKQTITY